MTAVLSIGLIEVDSGLSGTELERWAAAQTAQGTAEFYEAHGLVVVERLVTAAKPLRDDECPHYVHDQPTAKDPSGALAYHYRLSDGRAAMNTFAGLSKQCGDEPSQSHNHENVEAGGNALLNRCYQNMATGEVWAAELADPCEAIGYERLGVMLSDFVLLEWFSPPDVIKPGATYNYLRTITSPFGVLAGGYAQKIVNGLWAQVGEMRQYRATLKALGLNRGAQAAARAA